MKASLPRITIGVTPCLSPGLLTLGSLCHSWHSFGSIAHLSLTSPPPFPPPRPPSLFLHYLSDYWPHTHAEFIEISKASLKDTDSWQAPCFWKSFQFSWESKNPRRRRAPVLSIKWKLCTKPEWYPSHRALEPSWTVTERFVHLLTR